MKEIIKNILVYIFKTIVYLLKTYLLQMISSGLFAALIAAITYDPTIHTHYGNPGEVFVLAAFLVPPYNSIVFLLLCFYRFNSIEIIVETCLVISIVMSGYLPELLDQIILLVLLVLIMGLYICIKKLILRKLKSDGEVKTIESQENTNDQQEYFVNTI